MIVVGDGTSLADRKRRAGQGLMIGFDGFTVDDDTRALIDWIQPSSFLLFGRNVAEPAQVHDLCRELKSLVDPHHPALVAVDQEGGTVQRIRTPATEWPDARTIQRSGQVEAVHAALALELRALGIDWTLAPVADVDLHPDNPVIGTRAFSTDPASTARAVSQAIAGLHTHDIMSCAKHFPGHGATTTDSHHELPVLDVPLSTLRRRELLPFRSALAANVASILMAHMVVPEVDEAPASLSMRWHRILRDELGYDGVVLCDDLEMNAIADHTPLPEAVRRFARASGDLALVCHTPSLQVEAFEARIRMQEDDAGHDGAAKTSLARLTALRERFLLHRSQAPTPESLPFDAHARLAERVALEGLA